MFVFMSFALLLSVILVSCGKKNEVRALKLETTSEESSVKPTVGAPGAEPKTVAPATDAFLKKAIDLGASIPIKQGSVPLSSTGSQYTRLFNNNIIMFRGVATTDNGTNFYAILDIANDTYKSKNFKRNFMNSTTQLDFAIYADVTTNQPYPNVIFYFSLNQDGTVITIYLKNNSNPLQLIGTIQKDNIATFTWAGDGAKIQ